MKNIHYHLLALLLMILVAAYSIVTPKFGDRFSDSVPETEFSAQRALKHVESIAQKPHYVGADDHGAVVEYLYNELNKLGLEAQIMTGPYYTSNHVFTYATNVYAKLPGSDPAGKSDLLVLSHYDSAPFSSLGASDNGAGVATLLESARAYLAGDRKHKNNIILCFTDGEEIGLMGARVFAQNYPHLDDVGMVINYDARGSRGVVTGIMQTAHKNGKFIRQFAKAKTKYPLVNSLYYEIYKTMPNATDATVFSGEYEIPSFFFAFEDDYFHYHTAIDDVNNLDINSLAAEGGYLLPLMEYFGENDMDFEADFNHVFFSIPFLSIVHYDYKYIFPLLILAWILFFGILFYGTRKNTLRWKHIGRGFLIFISALILTGGVFGFLGWKLIMWLFPNNGEIIQGFPYTGYAYISFFWFLSLAVLLWFYNRLGQKLHTFNLTVAPLFFWLVINTFFAVSFQGGAFYIIPTFFVELALFISLYRKTNSILLMFLCGIVPVVWILGFSLTLPVALPMEGLAMGLIMFTVLFGLLLPFLDFLKLKKPLGILSFLIALFFLVKAIGLTGFSEKNPKPNSLVYELDLDSNTATWNSFDHILDDWTRPYFPDQKKKVSKKPLGEMVGLKGLWGDFTIYQKGEAPAKPIPGLNIEKEDTLIGDRVNYKLTISPERKTNLIVIKTDKPDDFKNLRANGVIKDDPKSDNSKVAQNTPGEANIILKYYVTQQEPFTLEFDLPGNSNAQLRLMSVSNDLLDNRWLEVPPRHKEMIPKTFVMNDAIITVNHLQL